MELDRITATLATSAGLVEPLRLVDEDVPALPSGDLAGAVGVALRLRAAAEGALAALVLEADSRGVVAQSDAAGVAAWVGQIARQVGVPVPAVEARQLQAVSTQTRRTADLGPLRAAVTSGRLPVAMAGVLVREYRKIRSSVSVQTWEACQQALLDYAADGASARQLAQARDAVIANYGAEGDFEADAKRMYACRSLTNFRSTKDGTYQATLTLDPASFAVVEHALEALSIPRPSPTPGSCCHDNTSAGHGHSHAGGHGSQGGLEVVGPDERTADQRRADALIDLCTKVSGVTIPELPGTGAKAQVIITMDFDKLRERLSYGSTLTGQPLTPTTVRMLACDAAITPMILGTASQPMDVGRTRRLVTLAQRLALYIRDRGCSFPGCDRPPSW